MKQKKENRITLRLTLEQVPPPPMLLALWALWHSSSALLETFRMLLP